ncbi:MAG TPA: hypothetical protein VFQ55_19170 [Casimicrobiaceae bacterium]|nr:hypothetical protein [Casimicrobiaceae bacterium]
MSALDPRLSRWLVWLAPFVLLAAVIGWQTRWGSELRRPPLAEPPIVPAPVATAVIPEFRIDGGTEAMKATVERPLFNASRRPAPSALADGPKPVIQRGQFQLTGTLITEKAAIAFLKETGGTGKARSVKKGDSLNGMLVAEVMPDRVKLTLGDESEDVELKVAKGPKTTIQPAATAAAAPAAPATGQAQAAAAPTGAAAARRPQTQAGGQPTDDARENVRAARRAARAAEAQQSGAQSQGAQGAAGTNNPQQGNTWADTYQRMQRRGK